MESPASTREQTLYRKYRPGTLDDVLGQDHVVTVLRNALERGRVAHAYLFAGPRGTGKTTIARILARRLNCEKPKGADACGDCSHCVASIANAALDIIEIDAASNRGIDEIRALKERIRLAPTSGMYKVYIVDEVHMLTKEAFNALLKTLEEPPSHAIFILATTELHKVPETIQSRCQTFLFRRAPVPLLVERLQKITKAEKVKVDGEALRLIASQSEGCFRDAEGLLGQVIAAVPGDIKVKDVETILGSVGIDTIQELVDHLIVRDVRAALKVVQGVSDRGASLRRFLDDLVRYLRAVASFSAANTHAEFYAPTAEEKLKNHADTGVSQLLPLLRLFLRAKTEMRDALYEELPIELAILEWCTVNEPKAPSEPPKNQDATGTPIGTIPAQAGTSSNTAAAPSVVIPAKAGIRESASKKASRKVDEPIPEGENMELFAKVGEIWQTFLERSAQLNPLLLSTLQTCAPTSIRGNTLYLVTDFSLYKERVSDMAVRTPLENLLAELLGSKVLLRVMHTKDAERMGLKKAEVPTTPATAHGRGPAAAVVVQRVTEAPNLTADAVSILGGEIIGGAAG